MRLQNQGNLTYCSNIHPGESWPEVYHSLQTYLPIVKQNVSPDKPMGIGLRLSNQASVELSRQGTGKLLNWMEKEGFYVFTMNGFPYGGFHRQRVKDMVHEPDWTTDSRVEYTIRLFDLLSKLVPKGMDGGISTSPLSYKPWWSQDKTGEVFRSSTVNLLLIVRHLHQYHQEKGILMHLDIEPEPDGLIENTVETISYFERWLLPLGKEALAEDLKVSHHEAESIILRHIQICYDVCHFAVAYESPMEVMSALDNFGIGVGKIQISSALKKEFASEEERQQAEQAFATLDEPTYLHQVIARTGSDRLVQYRDLPQALLEINNPEVREWRTHFHVPIFVENYGILQSTGNDISEVLKLWAQRPMTNHLEVETYTWEVLPDNLQIEISASIARELNWVLEQLSTS